MIQSYVKAVQDNTEERVDEQDCVDEHKRHEERGDGERAGDFDAGV